MKLVIKYNNEISTVEITYKEFENRDTYLRIKNNDIVFQSHEERIVLSESKFELFTSYTYETAITRVKNKFCRYSVSKNINTDAVGWLVFNQGIFVINNAELQLDSACLIEIEIPDTASVYLHDIELKFNEFVYIENEYVAYSK